MSINAIVARDKSFGIGYGNALPWPKLSRDMKRFVQLTSTHTIVMGRKTWESIGCKPLPNRENIVVSDSGNVKISGKSGPDYIFTGEQFLRYLDTRRSSSEEVFIIGGAQIYSFAQSYIDKWYITKIKSFYPCDTYFNPSWTYGFYPLYSSGIIKDGNIEMEFTTEIRI